MVKKFTAVLLCVLGHSCNTLSLHSEEAVENRLDLEQLQAVCLGTLHLCFNHIPDSIESGFVPPQILKEEPRDDNIVEIAAFVLNLFLRELSEEDLQKVENGTYASENYIIIQESYLKQFLAHASKLHPDDNDQSTALTLAMYLYREQFLLQIVNYIRLVFGLPLFPEPAYSPLVDKLFFRIWRRSFARKARRSTLPTGDGSSTPFPPGG